MLNSEDLINKVKVYNKFLNPEKLNKAYNFAVKAHSNQKRASGDPYSVHPIEVANILTELKLDKIAIVGLGYVGLPLSLQFAESGIRVLGVDLDETKIALLKEGKRGASSVDYDIG